MKVTGDTTENLPRGKITDSDYFKQDKHCKETSSNTDFCLCYSQVIDDLHYKVWPSTAVFPPNK